MSEATYCNVYKRKALYYLSWVAALLFGLFIFRVHLEDLDSSLRYSIFIGLIAVVAIKIVCRIFAQWDSATLSNEDLSLMVSVGDSSDPTLSSTVRSLVKVNGAVYESDLRSILKKLIILDKTAHRDYAIQQTKPVSISGFKSEYDSSIKAVNKILGRE